MTHIKNTIDLGINKVLEFCFFSSVSNISNCSAGGGGPEFAHGTYFLI